MLFLFWVVVVFAFQLVVAGAAPDLHKIHYGDNFISWKPTSLLSTVLFRRQNTTGPRYLPADSLLLLLDFYTFNSNEDWLVLLFLLEFSASNNLIISFRIFLAEENNIELLGKFIFFVIQFLNGFYNRILKRNFGKIIRRASRRVMTRIIYFLTRWNPKQFLIVLQ